MTLQADRRRLGRAQGFEANDLCDIAPAIDMGLARTVAGLTSVLIAFKECRVRGSGKMLFPDVLVASFADIVCGVLSPGWAGKRGGCLLRFATRLSGAGNA